jgi:flagellar assembly protein FliH
MCSSAGTNSEFVASVMTFEYPDLAEFPVSAASASHTLTTRFAEGHGKSHIDGQVIAAETEEKIKLAKAEGAFLARQEYEQRLEATRATIAAALTAFETEKAEYYARIESEVVQLALAIAAKILHREAQVDPMLVATLVRMAMEKMHDGSSVTVRVSSGNGKRWKETFDRHPGSAHFEVVEDTGLSDKDCVLETELGSTNFGLESQLKEVEQGFFDLLALRPVNS